MCGEWFLDSRTSWERTVDRNYQPGISITPRDVLWNFYGCVGTGVTQTVRCDLLPACMYALILCTLPAYFPEKLVSLWKTKFFIALISRRTPPASVVVNFRVAHFSSAECFSTLMVLSDDARMMQFIFRKFNDQLPKGLGWKFCNNPLTGTVINIFLGYRPF